MSSINIPDIIGRKRVPNKIKAIMTEEKTPSFVVDIIDTYIINSFIMRRVEQGKDTISKSVSVTAAFNDVLAWMVGKFIIVQSDEQTTIGISDDVSFEMTNKKWAVKVDFTGDSDAVKEMIAKISDRFENNPCYIRWVHDPQYLDDITMPLNNHHLPVSEMYPFLNGETVESYFERFMKSSANILVLFGPPGTGKTTFIRGLLAHTKQSATLTYHQKILEQDAFFVNWLESKDTFMILEDADTLLLPRTDGNDLMARFLNMGDGLMGFTNKKIVFSTNLPSTTDIDDALVRPGRCFDTLEFGTLNREQAKALCDKIDVDLPDGDTFTISELFASKKNEVAFKRKNTFGFC